MSGTGEIRNGEIGILKEDLQVGTFGEEGVIFTLPKGILVRDVQQTGAGWFENNRFRVVVTSDRDDLVDYDYSVPEDTKQNSEIYSADVTLNR